MSFTSFYKKNLAFAKLAIQTNLEYRFNYFIDAIAQPAITTIIESILWFAIFAGLTQKQVNGFGLEYYLSYALWAGFMARISSNWMYEFMMSGEIESGRINAILVRPVSLYEYYLSQLLGYKFITTIVSFIFPISVIAFFKLPTEFNRLPLAILLVLFHLFLIHTISFIVSCLAFYLNRVRSFTTSKNLLLMVLSGELVPLDLIPAGAREFFIALPFSSGVYIPVGYITGRFDTNQLIQGFYSNLVGLLVAGIIAFYFWKKGIKSYVGTGA